jgi:hypothetical protein
MSCRRSRSMSGSAVNSVFKTRPSSRRLHRVDVADTRQVHTSNTSATVPHTRICGGPRYHPPHFPWSPDRLALTTSSSAGTPRSARGGVGGAARTDRNGRLQPRKIARHRRRGERVHDAVAPWPKTCRLLALPSVALSRTVTNTRSAGCAGRWCRVALAQPYGSSVVIASDAA